MSQVTQMPIPLQEGAARSPHSKGKVPQNEEDHKLRQLQTQTLPDLALLCSCSRSSPVWELDGCLCHLHLGSGSSQALTASPSGLGCRKELINPPLPCAAFHLSAPRFLSLPDISEALSRFDNAGSAYNSCSRPLGTGY